MAILTQMPLAILLLITSLVLRASATRDYGDGDGDQKPIVRQLPYFCVEPIPAIEFVPCCCFHQNRCADPRCGGERRELTNITDSRQLLGAVDVLVDGKPVPVTGLANLDLERNFISTPLVKSLG